MAKNQQGGKPSEPKNQQPTQPAQPRTANVRIRGEKVLQHHLFESDVKNCLKNVSYNPKEPRLEGVPHKHFFHTIDSRGRRLSESSIILNHFHKIEWGMDTDTGDLYAKSGPAMRMATIHHDDGNTEVMPERVGWKSRGKTQYDEHTHEWTYVDTEEFTPNSLEARRKSNRDEIGAVMVQPIQTAEPFNANDPATIVPTSGTSV